MLGLVAYDSSEDEVETKVPITQRKSSLSFRPKTVQPKVISTFIHFLYQSVTIKANILTAPDLPSNINIQIQPKLSGSAEAPSGPVLGPAAIDQAPSPEGPSTSGRSSPFSASRALIQNLTLPSIPNLDIPESPPGSPDLAVNAKFEHFLSLKKQGVHFNAKLASSSSLKNPSLLMKMMQHAGIDEGCQYDTSLPEELWSTYNLPKWGFKEELLRAQQVRQNMDDKKASGQRSSIEFVAGSSANPSH
ncbi:hypothetical protein N7495_006097 [Penicillium taxi]|uniref:uncharacterized protein n=1 Tax=Penicillium taxi TaxID=168475 RepID=UPI0025456B4C|nr:uncharacterized protein N7495_006097 [Penicillium taxi]KAJ5894406.1 hypothetical protein N7495_006097 [Penicillium taxi]